MKGSGCAKCPVSEWDCDAQYRGSRCAALRAKAGADFNPKTNADMIRAMNDEELADWIYLEETIEHPDKKRIWDWLRQPAEDMSARDHENIGEEDKR